MSEPRFIEVQRAFARYLREPDSAAAPESIEARRIGIYGYAVRNAANSFLSDNFPLTRGLFADDAWEQIVSRYMQIHQVKTHEYAYVPLEFLQFIEAGGLGTDAPVFASELADFEWMETKVSIDQREVDPTAYDRSGDLMQQRLVFNPVAELKVYAYPVHRALADGVDAVREPAQSLVLVFRNLALRADFVELNPMATALYGRLTEHPDESAHQAVLNLVKQFGLPDVDAAILGSRQILERWLSRDILLGVAT